MYKCKYLIWILTLVYPGLLQGQVITTIAGTGIFGYNGDGIPATTAQIKGAVGIGLDNKGNVYSADGTSRIRKINISGIISTIVGTDSVGFSGDGGPATAALVRNPTTLCLDKYDNVYFFDQGNGRIRRIDTSGVITTYAGTGLSGYSGDGGPATAAKIGSVNGIAIDTFGNLYLSDQSSYRLRKVDVSGIITTIAGTGTFGFSGDGGPASAATINGVTGISCDRKGNIYFSDFNNNRVRKIDATGIISTAAGTGVLGYTGDGGAATAAQISYVNYMANDSAGNLFIIEKGAGRICRISTAGIINWVAGDGTLTGFAGDGGPATAAKFNLPFGIATDPTGTNIYISDKNNYRIRHFTYTDGTGVPQNNGLAAKITCTPNPSNAGLFTLNTQSNISEQASIIITSITGQKILELTTTTNNPTEIQLHAPAGVYFVTVSTEHGLWNEKVAVY